MAITLNGTTGVTTTGLTSNGIDDNATSTAMTLDSSGNVLVGKTSIGLSTTGIDLRSTGLLQAIRNGGTVVELNRQTSDGTIIDFRKDNTTVGSIGTRGGHSYIGSGDTALKFLANSDAVVASTAVDGSGRADAIDLGQNGNAFKDLYLSGGVYLGGTGAANKLDDYEEGTWTPVFGGTSTLGTYTYGEQQGHYVKIGSQVTVWFNLTDIATVTQATGNIRISGLPFTTNWQSGFNGEATGQLNMNNFTGLDGNTVWGQVTDGSTHINVYFNSGANNNTGALPVTSKVSNASDVRGFATYITSS